jgi:glycine oxidase
MNGAFDRMNGHGLPASRVHPDFLIIGAGAVGLSSALELAERGASVVVMDQGAAGSESTWAGAGILSPLPPWAYDDPVNRLVTYSLGLFPDWCASLRALSGVEPEFLRSGMLVLSPGATGPALAWCRRHGWPCFPSQSEVFLSNAPGRPALWLPDVAQVRNPRLIRALRGALGARGIVLMEGARALGLDAEAGRVAGVLTDQGRMACGACIVAAGAASARIPGLEFLAERVFPVRGQMLLYKLPVGTLAPIVYEEGHYLVPRVDGHLLVGSTLERVGFDKSVTPGAREELQAFAESLLPELKGMQPIGHWSGLRPGSPDNVPLICHAPGHVNLYLNTGHYRYGVTMAPGAAKLLASLIYREAPPIPAGAYDYA